MERRRETKTTDPQQGVTPRRRHPVPRPTVEILPKGAALGTDYTVLSQLGQGGMGLVYLVEHVGLGRRFAAKVVGNELPEAATERLFTEARVTSAITHPNIVDVVHVGRDVTGPLFVIMELLQGEDLGQRLLRAAEASTEQRWLPDDEVRTIARQIFSGLSAAHRAGVIHRDMKPENVFLTEGPDGEKVIKLLDFGIARVVSDENPRLTHTGQVMGTPLYMAPEQARSLRDADERSDLYAVGVMLYEMITGAPPFESETVYDLILKHATKPPVPPRERRLDLEPAVENVILRCLAKEPEGRFESIEALAEAWDAAWRGEHPEPAPGTEEPEPEVPEAVVAPPAPAPGPNRALWFAAAVIAVAASFATWFAVSRPVPDANADTTSAPVEAEPEEDTSAQPPEGVEAPDVDPPVLRLIQSQPQSAEVHEGETLLGTTPLNVSVPPGEQRTLVLSHPGHESEEITIDAAEDGRVDVELARLPAAGRRRRPRPSQSNEAAAPEPASGQTGILLGMEEFDSQDRR